VLNPTAEMVALRTPDFGGLNVHGRFHCEQFQRARRSLVSDPKILGASDCLHTVTRYGLGGRPVPAKLNLMA
jgi:hypothetical protein